MWVYFEARKPKAQATDDRAGRETGYSGAIDLRLELTGGQDSHGIRRCRATMYPSAGRAERRAPNIG
jgi:hypothetical protein